MSLDSKVHPDNLATLGRRAHLERLVYQVHLAYRDHHRIHRFMHDKWPNNYPAVTKDQAVNFFRNNFNIYKLKLVRSVSVELLVRPVQLGHRVFKEFEASLVSRVHLDNLVKWAYEVYPEHREKMAPPVRTVNRA